MEKVVASFSNSDGAKEHFLRGVRDTQGDRGETAYLAYCAKYPGSVLERVEVSCLAGKHDPCGLDGLRMVAGARIMLPT